MDESTKVVVATKEATPESKTPVVRLGTVTGKPVEIKSKDGKTLYKCQYCGKYVNAEDSIENEAGSYCEHLREEGYDEVALAKVRSGKTVDKVPVDENGKEWVKIAVVHRLCDKHNIPISRLVKAFGGDRGLDPVLHPAFAFVYVGRARYISPWCATTEGLAFLKTLGQSGSPNPEAKTTKPVKSVKPATKVEEALAPTK